MAHFIEQAVIYLPEEWRHALAAGELLPKRAEGAALFADIAGFTPISEKLSFSYGPREGAEMMSMHLNRSYDALCAQINRYGGSVVDFAGDSITCWFDQDSPGLSSRRACAAALAMQAAIDGLPGIDIPGEAPLRLGVKISVASGPARRFLVGDPAIQRFAVMAGDTLQRATDGEHLAKPGQVWIDQATVSALGDQAALVQQASTERGDLFHCLQSFRALIEPAPWPELRYELLTEEQVRPWLLQPIYKRLQENVGEFVTELRPAVSLFLRFTGLDFDGDPQVGKKLDELVCGVQKELNEHKGILLQLTIGDKGSYLYAVFGAPLAHEDDARRALLSALALREFCGTLDSLDEVQIGITQGTMRTGSYGSKTRRSYGVMGDDVNLAARLMSRSKPGEILVSNRLYKSITSERAQSGSTFRFDPRPPVPVKGKSEPVAVFAVTGSQLKQPLRLQEPEYGLPMVGRQAERAMIEEKIHQTLAGQGQVVSICADAGMGKSRLAAEVIRMAHHKGMDCFGGACQSEATNTPYFVWGPIWRAFFDFNPEAALKRQIRSVTAVVEDYAPGRLDSTPLLGPLLGMQMPDNEFSAELEPQYMKMALEALLVDCLKGAAKEAAGLGGGLLFILEDLHWVDPASLDLLERAARACAGLPVLILLIYRPPEIQHPHEQRVSGLPNFTRIELHELSENEAEQAARAKFAQLYPEWHGPVPLALLRRVVEQAQGNPFYAEELLNYLNHQNADLHDIQAVEILALPGSLQSLILSRIDQLTSKQQFTLRSASVIGRVFQEKVVSRMLEHEHVAIVLEKTLSELQSRELILRLEVEEKYRAEDPLKIAGLEYIFKHILILEVTYLSLLTAQRKLMHRLAAETIEEMFPDHLEDLSATLAYHYEQGEVADKALHYLELAARRAQALYANDEAIRFYQKALAQLKMLHLTEAGAVWHEKELDLLEQLADMLALTGRNDESIATVQTALEQAETGDWKRRSQLYRKIVKVLVVQLKFDAIRETNQLAEEALGPVQDTPEWRNEWLEAKLLNASSCYWTRDLEKMSRMLDEIEPALQQFGTRAQRYLFLKNINSLRLSQQRYLIDDETVKIIQEASHLARDIGDIRQLVEVSFRLAFCFLWANQLEKAVHAYNEALELAQKTGDVVWELRMLSYLTVAERRLGHVEIVEKLVPRCLEGGHRLHMPEYVFLAHANQAWADWKQGNLERFDAAIDAIKSNSSTVLPMYWVFLFPAIAVALARGQVEQAVEHARAILTPPQKRLEDQLVLALTKTAEDWDAGRPAEARSMLEQSLMLAKEYRYL
jgi:adenylate cyclase